MWRVLFTVEMRSDPRSRQARASRMRVIRRVVGIVGAIEFVAAVLTIAGYLHF